MRRATRSRTAGEPSAEPDLSSLKQIVELNVALPPIIETSWSVSELEKGGPEPVRGFVSYTSSFRS